MEVPGKTHTICQPCNSTGEQVPAESFCEDCNEYLCHGCCNDHRKFAVLRHHKLTDASAIDTAVQQQQQQQRGSKPTTTCKIHVDKLIEFYCRDHNVTVCGACAVVDHISCKPEYIPDVSKHYKDSDKYKAVRDELDNLLVKTRSLRERTETNIELTKENVESTVEDIKKSQQETIDNVNSTYEQRITEARTMQEEDTTALYQTQTTLDLVERELLDTQSHLSNLEPQSSDLFIAGTNITTRSEQIQARIREYEMTSSAFSYMFDKKIKTLPLIGPLTRIPRSGETGSNEDNQACVPTEPLSEPIMNIDWKTCKLAQKGSLNISNHNNGNCTIVSLHLLDSIILLLSDYDNNNIKKFDITANKIISSLSFSSFPWQIAKLPNLDHVAVSFRDEQKIRIISTTGDLIIQRTLDVKGTCRGLCSTSDGNLVVSFTKPVKLEVITLDGNVVYSLLHPSLHEFLVGRPLYLISESVHDKEFVYVSDCDNNTLLRLQLDLKETNHVLVYRDKDLAGARGLTLTGDGHLLVCCRTSRTVQIVTLDGRKVRDLVRLDSDTEPQSILFDAESKTIYIGTYRSQNVLVYKIQ